MEKFADIKSFISFIESCKRFSKKTSLDKMKFFSELFNHPESKFPSIHITGTNGKGSTVSFLRQIYMEKGLKVATFISPYIIKFNERICINNEFISDDDLLKYGNEIVEKLPLFRLNGFEDPTFFEYVTMIAFLYFSSIKDLDIAIIEVGMGGRLDATNIITPLVCGITNVSLEHMKQLGPTTKAILKEKLGIVKPNVPLVTTISDSDLINDAINYTKNLNSNCIVIDNNDIKSIDVSLKKTSFVYKNLNVELQLLGFHQISNACLAIEIINTINNLEKEKSNFYVSNELLLRGLKNTTWPGRLEKVSNEPLIYLDGGHNIDCIKRICEFIDSLNLKYVRCVTSISHDKELSKMIDLLDKSCNEIIFTKYTYKRSAEAIDIYNMSKLENKKIINNVNDVVKYLYDNPAPFTIIIGSLYLVSEIRPLFLKN